MVIVPQKIDRLTETNLKYKYPYWSAGTTYISGDIVLHEKYNYMSIVENNLGNAPSIDSGLWMVMGVDNVYAAIDLNSMTSSIGNDETIENPVPGSYDVMFAFGAAGFKFVGLGFIVGRNVLIEELDASGVTLSEKWYILEQSRPCCTDWYNYYFCPVAGPTLGFENILYIVQNENLSFMRITIYESLKDGYSSLGYMIGGVPIYVGDALYPADIGLDNQSITTINHLGITVDQTRDVREIMTIDTMMDADQTQTIKKNVRRHLLESVLFIGDTVEPEKTLYENLLMLGKVDDFNIVMTDSTKSYGYLILAQVL